LAGVGQPRDDEKEEELLDTPLHVVVLGAWMPFPHGMATTNRVRLLARALREAGADVRVLCLQAVDRPPQVENTVVRGTYEGVEFEYATCTTVRHRSFPMRRLIAAWGWTHGAARLTRLRRERRLDVIYLWFGDPEPSFHKFLFLALFKLLGVPVVSELNEQPWSLRENATAIHRRMSPLFGVSGFVSISEFLGNWAQGEAGRLGRSVKIIQVPIVVDVNEQPLTDYPSDEPLVVFAGSPGYDETIRFILTAMDQVWRKVPQCRLVVTGANPSDPAAGWLFAEAARLGADARLSFPGYLCRAELLKLYARSHALLIPLFDDVRSKARFPTKIGEYLAAARPIVTTAVGEIPRYFEDQVNAAVCAPGDPALYGAKIVALLNAPDLAASIGRRGRDTAAACFHYELFSETLGTGFAAVAGKAPSNGEACGKAVRQPATPYSAGADRIHDD
jgi:glycosyltransferase involved in cell wall biosynthesis